MLTRRCHNHEALVRFGLGVADMTPPVGIYHRMFGAAAHDRATGVHRPLQVDVMAIGAADGNQPNLIRAELDHCGFVGSQHNEFVRRVSASANVPEEQVVVAYSHSHSTGWCMPDRFSLPGGELIPAYLEKIGAQLEQATRAAVSAMAPAVFTFGTARSDMAAHRDCWDEQANFFVCGYNPGGVCDDTVTVARIASPTGVLRAVLVHYGCHPTTLGWQNSLISPDFIGATREVVSAATGVPCVYWQGACGDVGPREGFVGDVAVADRNGRRLGYAALAALESLGPPESEFHYAGPVISGATLGTWQHVPLDDAARRERLLRLAGERRAVGLAIRDHGDPAALEAERGQWEQRATAASQRGDEIAARDGRARAERIKRTLGRIANLPGGEEYPLSASVHVVGESLWITSGGEPYQCLAIELRKRFPELTVLYSPLADGIQAGYLLPRSEYGKGLYQEEPSAFAPGCLEALTESLAERGEALLSGLER